MGNTLSCNSCGEKKCKYKISIKKDYEEGEKYVCMSDESNKPFLKEYEDMFSISFDMFHFDEAKCYLGEECFEERFEGDGREWIDFENKVEWNKKPYIFKIYRANKFYVQYSLP